MARLLRTYGLDLLLVACLILSGLRLTTGLEAVLDITLFDETGYLFAGTHLRSEGLMPPAWAPLYGVWYFALAQLQPDPVALYYLNYKLLSVAAPVLIFVLLRAYELPRLLALLCAWFFLMAAANLPVWPKPGSFALCLAIVFLIAARDRRAPTRSVLLLALGALLCSYVRPEYALAAALLLGLYLGLLWRRRALLHLRVELAQLILFLVVALAVVNVFGLAALDRNNNRSFEAFAQHYAINWAAWNNVDLDPWNEAEVAIAASFGAVDSLGEATRANAGAVARHLATNLLSYPGALAGAFFVHFTPLLPDQAPWARSAGAWLLGLGALGALIWGLWLSRRELPARLRAQGLRLAMFALLCAPAAAAAVVVYPRIHYLLLQGVLVALALGLLAAGAPGQGRRAALVCVTAAIGLLALTPPVGATWFAHDLRAAGQPNRATIAFIGGLGLTAPTNLLEAEGGFHVYLGDQFRRVPHTVKEAGALSFLREQQIGLVVVSEKLRRDQRYAGDPEWQAILADPAAAGFEQLAIPGTDRQILLAREP